METKAQKVRASAAGAAAERAVEQQPGTTGRPERKADRTAAPRAAN